MNLNAILGSGVHASLRGRDTHPTTTRQAGNDSGKDAQKSRVRAVL